MKNPKSKYYQTPSKSQIPKSKKDKIFDIRERTFQFGLRVLDIAEMLPRTNVGDVLRSQLVRSGTSIGANLEEGDGSNTKRDFINKVVLARKEAKETKYWLRVITHKYFKKNNN